MIVENHPVEVETAVREEGGAVVSADSVVHSENLVHNSLDTHPDNSNNYFHLCMLESCFLFEGFRNSV